MKRQDIIFGLIVLVILAGVIYVRQRSQRPVEETRVPETLSSEETFEDKFNIQIPDDVDKAELKDVSGGSGSGIATRKFENNIFKHSVLVDLPNPEQGSFYEAWLIKGEEGSGDFSAISTGKLRLAKGGWTLDFQGANDLSDHSKVVVSLEKTFDKTIESKVLEGSF
jgi:hypothetical protein